MYNTFNWNDSAWGMIMSSGAPHMSARTQFLFSCLVRTWLLWSRELLYAGPLCLTQQQTNYKILNPLNSLIISKCIPSKSGKNPQLLSP